MERSNLTLAQILALRMPTWKKGAKVITQNKITELIIDMPNCSIKSKPTGLLAWDYETATVTKGQYETAQKELLFYGFDYYTAVEDMPQEFVDRLIHTRDLIVEYHLKRSTKLEKNRFHAETWTPLSVIKLREYKEFYAKTLHDDMIYNVVVKDGKLICVDNDQEIIPDLVMDRWE